jgi:hypothetical protein
VGSSSSAVLTDEAQLERTLAFVGELGEHLVHCSEEIFTGKVRALVSRERNERSHESFSCHSPACREDVRDQLEGGDVDF